MEPSQSKKAQSKEVQSNHDPRLSVPALRRTPRAEGTQGLGEPSDCSRRSEPWDPLRIYLREVSAYPLLSRREEEDLAGKIKEGDPKARERMILSNLRLVVAIAKSYQGFGLAYLDTINLGNIGLMKAVERFEAGKGAKFSTYAVPWIRQEILRGLSNQARTVRLPEYKVYQLSRLKRVQGELEVSLGREASEEELADEARVSVRYVREMRSFSYSTTSLDAPIGPEGKDTLASNLADEAASPPSELSERGDRYQALRGCLDRLPERERAILMGRFGFDGGQGKTLQEIATEFGLTRQRIRQIEERALNILKRYTRRLKLDE